MYFFLYFLFCFIICNRTFIFLKFFCHPCDVYDMKKANGVCVCETRRDEGRAARKYSFSWQASGTVMGWFSCLLWLMFLFKRARMDARFWGFESVFEDIEGISTFTSWNLKLFFHQQLFPIQIMYSYKWRWCSFPQCVLDDKSVLNVSKGFLFIIF